MFYYYVIIFFFVLYLYCFYSFLDFCIDTLLFITLHLAIRFFLKKINYYTISHLFYEKTLVYLYNFVQLYNFYQFQFLYINLV